jgi:hypothetical protein
VADAHLVLGAGAAVQVSTPRVIGLLAAVWSGTNWLWPGGWASLQLFLGSCALWTVASVWLLLGRHVPVGGTLLVLACGVQLVGQPTLGNEPAVLLGWAGMLIAVSEDRPRERALLLRVLVTSVYAYTALAKLNPSFLSGEQLTYIAESRPQMGWTLGLASGPLGSLASWGTVLVELSLAAGLWFRRTRFAAAMVGCALHVVLIAVAATAWGRDVGFLLVLNLGLVALYPAFWVEVRPPPIPSPARHDGGVSGHSSRT